MIQECNGPRPFGVQLQSRSVIEQDGPYGLRLHGGTQIRVRGHVFLWDGETLTRADNGPLAELDPLAPLTVLCDGRLSDAVPMR